MARRSRDTNKGVEEKRRMLPIYQHYTLSPGKTKSHHPEAKCNHCLKEFVCGSKQRLIRHLRKCNSISNPEQIIAETLNTLARNSATGQLNHSILEASNLLPSQISHIQHSNTQQLVGQAISQSPSSTNAAVNNVNNSNDSNLTKSGSTAGAGVVGNLMNGSNSLNDTIPVKRQQRRGRKPGNSNSGGSGIHVTTGIDGKSHFTPASQLPQATVAGTPIIAQVHNGLGAQISYAYQTVASSSPASINPTSAHLNAANSGQISCATSNHHSTPFKLNSEPIDKAYLKLVLTRNLPLSLCDTKEFQLWVKTFANDYKPPSSINLIAQNLKNEAQAAKQRVSNILVKAPKKTINLELHNWHDELHGCSWYGVVASVDYKRFLISIKDVPTRSINANTVMNRSEVSAPDKVLTDFVDECIKRVGSDRINSMVLAGKEDVTAPMGKTRQSLYTTHPSIVTYNCWWHFTNLLCSDIIEQSEVILNVMRNSNCLMNYVDKQPMLKSSLEKFAPFGGISGYLCPTKDDSRWYSHLVCYLLEYIKNNNDTIIRAFEHYSPSVQHLPSDNNNNSSSSGNDSQAQQIRNSSTQQNILYQDEVRLMDVKTVVMSAEFWTDLNSALSYLKPIREVVALTSTTTSVQNNSPSSNNSSQQLTPSISPIAAHNFALGDYLNWYLALGRDLFESWRTSPDNFKYNLIGQYIRRFNSSINDFKLLLAAYLLNPKHRCAYLTSKAKDLAIEEILNIASEFMPEESDGHTIFDQWKLYLVREEPYDMVFEESRSNALDWWISLPCAESIRRVALRILRLKAFTSPKPDMLFSQLYFYEDETRTTFDRSAYENMAILRYFYDYEDKIGQPNHHNNLHNHTSTSIHSLHSIPSNGCTDRTQTGQTHNEHLHQSQTITKFSPPGPNETSVLQLNGLSAVDHSKQNFVDSYDTVETYMNHTHIDMNSQVTVEAVSDLSLENLPGYDCFSMYVDFNESGVQVVEEPVEKKKRKWTAQEILSKCQTNHQNNNNSNSSDIDRK